MESLFGDTPPQVWSIVGGQAGSEGKGKVAALLAFQEKPDIAVCAFSPNAGHTAFTPEGEKYVFHQLPVGVLNPSTTAYIGPGSLVDVDLLKREITALELGPERVRVDYRAWSVLNGDKEVEAREMNAISSTCQGVGAALERRISRHRANVPLEMIMTGRWADYLDDTTELLRKGYNDFKRIQIEGSQGVDIDLLHGIQYPYCTSRSIIAGSVASDCGIPATAVERTVMVCRTYPIRVGNAFDKMGKQIGWSGPIPDDSVELTWEEITELAGSPTSLLEKTTVTQKVRRIFTWSDRRFQRACWLNGATDIFLGFVNYVDWGLYQKSDWSEVSVGVRQKFFEWEGKHLSDCTIPVLAYGTGPAHSDFLPRF